MRLVLGIMLAAVLGIGAPPASASPNKAKWRREVLLGANDSLFVSLVFSWDQPGTYYQNSDSAALELRRSKDGTLFLKQPLWTTVDRMDPKTNVWSAERSADASFELNETFVRYSLKAIVPYAHPLIQWAIDGKGIYLTARGQSDKAKLFREEVLPMKNILAQHPELSSPEFTDPFRISGIYSHDESSFYVVLSAGYPADVPCYEEIVVLDRERLRGVEKRLLDQLWK